MERWIDEFSKGLTQPKPRRDVIKALLAVLSGLFAGVFALPGRVRAESLANCRAFCLRYPASDGQRNACLSTCVACASVSLLCGTTGFNTVCCVGSVPNGSYACQSNSCVIACNPGYTNCSGSCVNEQTDPDNCGACGSVCSGNHVSTRICSSGICTGICDTGWGNCNGGNDGCETNVFNSVNNCGSCGHVCPPAQNASPTCVSGNCTFSCDTGYRNCNNNPADGCEINITNDVNNCGTCGQSCANLPNATVGCSNSQCVVASCNAGFANCNGSILDGCETNITNNVNNCGGCFHQCFVPNGSAGCVNSQCVIASCNPGFANCNGSAVDGCETNIFSSISNCGSCGHVCFVPNGTPACSNGQCIILSCNAGYADCDGFAGNGCETNITIDRNNCGACGRICASGKNCVSGNCV